MMISHDYWYSNSPKPFLCANATTVPVLIVALTTNNPHPKASHLQYHQVARKSVIHCICNRSFPGEDLNTGVASGGVRIKDTIRLTCRAEDGTQGKQIKEQGQAT